MALYKTGNSVPSSAMPDIWDDNQVQDIMINSDELEVETRTGKIQPTWSGLVKINADAIEETRQNLIPLSRQYMTLAAAQADIANIPVGSTTYYRSPDDSALAVEVMNVSGTLQPTGRKMPSQAAVEATKTSETNAKASETAAKTSETNAKASETSAKTSETNAKESETAAKTSETNAKTSETNAKTSETNAKTSETNAKTSETNAKTSETNAKISETNAAESKRLAEAAAEVATANLETALPASAYIKDVSRHAVERASGGRQTVLYDDLGNPSVMNIIPIFRYEDLGYSEDMGAGVVSCFDVGTGANKSEIFIGAFQSSLVGSRAVSLPRTDPAVSVNFDAAKGYCANKGAGWHLMTMHEWAAISLWCMANGFEPRGNTGYGRAHDRYVERGRRNDGGLPGDTAGTASVHAGSGPDAWRHNNSPWGISDLVGNVWEWLDGFKLQEGQIIASTFNTQAEASWAAQAAYFDSTLTTGGAPRLSDAVVNRLGTIGNNANGGYLANASFNGMEKAGTYVSNQLLKRLLVEPSTVLPKGRVYMRNFGERLPYRGGDWRSGGYAGLAALYCSSSRVYASSSFGFRLAFA
ncbi:TPA: SUMF1/EgtB/PvdO family nonheme iron enzyme [Klebsiella quasipneumoniae]|nr:SUMF1/EgtB/PvdO family nonheme iron enzyme [Klebsiella quasipneumoniae]